MEYTEKEKERFWSKVQKAGEYECWKWLGAMKDNRQYGQVMIRNKHESAHRLSYMMTMGDIPEGMVVLHICDHPWCVNPNHLKVGTQKDNIHDMIWKGRAQKIDRSTKYS